MAIPPKEEVKLYGPEQVHYSMDYLRTLPVNEFWGFAGMTQKQIETTLGLFDTYQISVVNLKWIKSAFRKNKGTTKIEDGLCQLPAYSKILAGYPFSVLCVPLRAWDSPHPTGESVQAGVYDLLNHYGLDLCIGNDLLGNIYIFAVWDPDQLKAQEPAYVKVPKGKYYSFNVQMYAPRIYSLDAGRLQKASALRMTRKSEAQIQKLRKERPELFVEGFRGDDEKEKAYLNRHIRENSEYKKAVRQESIDHPHPIRTPKEARAIARKAKREQRIAEHVHRRRGF